MARKMVDDQDNAARSTAGLAPEPGYLPVCELNGDAKQRGRQIGRQTTHLIEHSIANYKSMFATCDISWQQACDKALPFLDYAQKICPDAVLEIEGMAEGSSFDMGSIAALNARTEILPSDYLARASGLLASDLPDNGHLNECTALAFSQAHKNATTASNCWLAQTWDWLGSQRESLVLLHVAHRYITAAEGGMLAKIGVNHHGLGITLNILRSTGDGQETGLAVHLFLRALLDCESVEEACELARSVKFSSSSNIVVADASGAIASIEASPQGAKIVESQMTAAAGADADTHRWLCHTNHFLHEDLAGCDAGLLGNISTQARLDAANAQVEELNNLADIAEVLSDTSKAEESICRFPDEQLPAAAQIETVFAAAMDLNRRELWATTAQPSITPFKRYPLH